MKEYRARNYKKGYYDRNPYFDDILDKFSNDTIVCEYSEEEKQFIKEESKIYKDSDYFTETTRQDPEVVEKFLKNQQKRFFIEYQKLSDSEKNGYYRSSTTQHCRNLLESSHHLPKHLWRLGLFQNVELITLKHAVYKFLRVHGITMTDFTKDILKQTVTQNIHRSLQFLFTYLPFRMFKSIYGTLIIHFHPQRFTPLTEEQKTQLLAIQRIYGVNWVVISNEMQQITMRITRFLRLQEEKMRQNKISLVKKKINPDDVEESQILQEYRDYGSFAQIARKYRVKVTFVRNHIIEAFSRVTLLEWNEQCNFITAIHVLKYNFYCTINKACDFIKFVDNIVQNYQIIQISQENTKFDQKIPDKCPEKSDVISSNMNKMEILNEKENKIFNQDIEQENKLKKSSVNKNDMQISGSNELLKFLIDENKKVSTNIDNFFVTDFNMNIKIDLDSIFWRSIMNNLPNYIQITNIETKVVISKFKQLCNSNNFTTFNDLIDWIKKFAYQNVLERVREIILQQREAQKNPKKNKTMSY
ncbi:putative Homeodomain-like protein [Pseudoloma neurophilia]|uniref:Putative Homeodomain-like protein n=1 Tax=Pseudoloma neurophilia TaxID=146866 RepID=A0A0R0M1Z1_9MICR|nr:putative Homeodomain-like protein [Pseudoloma neurophilia]